MKPLPTLMRPLRSVDLDTGEPGEALVERSDVQAVEALAVVAEAAVAWELARAAREKFGGDALADFLAAHAAYLERIRWPSALNALGPPSRARRVHGRGEVDARARARGAPRTAVRLRRRRCRGTDRLAVAELFAERGQAGVPRARGARCRRGSHPSRFPRSSSSEAARSAPSRRGSRSPSMRSRFSSRPRRRRRGSASRPGGRPLARDSDEFSALFEERTPLYEAVADGHARDLDGVLLAAAGVHIWEGAVDGLGGLAPGEGAIELVVDAGVEPLHGERARRALGARLAACHVVRAGEQGEDDRRGGAALVEPSSRSRGNASWRSAAGSTTDLAGFVAASYLRGVRVGCRCRRRSSPRSTPPSAGRRPSTSSEARTSLARFTGLRGSSPTPSSWRRFPPRSSGTVSPRW